ncbi:MAG: MFS transporter [Saprospiraceae bacterium]|nr:MFS transporter [Saprospiraceae bacterium]MCB9318463.1 MFS transporter [Lewinellaceae bacterium]
MRSIPKTVITLGLISLFTDMASEMLYPVLPLFMTEVGFTVFGIGLLEGFAQLLVGYAKGYFGRWSDVSKVRVPFIQWGYTLSAVAKPLMGVIMIPAGIFVLRSLDRLGKGVRTAARDALLAQEATSSTKGRIFGFHRSMDTLGASLGPLLALFFLWAKPDDLRSLFYLAIIPGMVAIWFAWRLRENAKSNSGSTASRPGFRDFLKYWKASPRGYQTAVGGLLIFGLLNSSDFFLLLQLQSLGYSEKAVIGFYIFYNFVYAGLAFPAGILADRWKFKSIFALGILCYGLVYGGMGIVHEPFFLAILFLLYGVYAAMTEGIAKAWISNLIPPKELATAIGTYEAFLSISAFLASLLAGWIWSTWGASLLFLLVGISGVILSAFFFLKPMPEKIAQ